MEALTLDDLPYSAHFFSNLIKLILCDKHAEMITSKLNTVCCVSTGKQQTEWVLHWAGHGDSVTCLPACCFSGDSGDCIRIFHCPIASDESKKL